MNKISFGKIINLLVFFALVALSVLDPVVTPVLIAYGVIWVLFQTKLSGIEVQDNENDNALNLTKILQGTTSILSNLNDMLGLIGDRIILEDAFSDDPDGGCDCEDHFDALTDQPREIYKPKINKDYWVVSFGMPNNIDRYTWSNDEADEIFFKMGNCFRSKKGAKEYAKKCVEIFKLEL